MKRYYFNENPQVRHWMGKCAMLQQELDTANETIDKICRYGTKLDRALINLTESAIQFNALPWYKKMFYKFNV
jgi:hypothetical protein